MEQKEIKNAYVRQVAEQKYEYGFTTDVHTDIIEKVLTRRWCASSRKRRASPTGCSSSA